MKLLQQLKSGLKRTIKWNQNESSVKTLAQNRYLSYLINPSFQGINRLFVLSFENENDRRSHSTHYFLKVEIKDYNVMIDGRNLFDQPINGMNKTYENIRRIATGQGDDYTTSCFLDYTYFKDHYKMVATDLSKQKALEADPREIQPINFTTNLDREGNTTMFFIIEKAKGTVFEFSQGTVSFMSTRYSIYIYIDFPHKLLLTDRQVSNLRKSLANNSSFDIKLSKTQLSKMIQSGGFLSRLLGPLLKTGLPLIKNVIKPLAKSVLILLGLTAAASAADAGIHKKMLGSGHNNTTTLVISNNEMEDIIKIVQTFEDFVLLLKGVTETVQNNVKEQKGGFLIMLLGTLDASLLGNLLTGKGINTAGEGIVRSLYVVLRPLLHIVIKWIFNTTSSFSKL